MLNLYAVVLTLIVAALLTVSLAQMRKVHNKADYLVAGRSLPAYVLVFTLLSSWIGAGSLFAGAENAFHNGFAALWQPAGGWAGLLIIYFVAPRARKFAQFTIPDLLEARYNTAAGCWGQLRFSSHTRPSPATSSAPAETSCTSSLRPSPRPRARL